MKCVFCASDINSNSCRNQNCLSNNDKSRIECRKSEDVRQPAQRSEPAEESKRPSITIQCLFCASEVSVKGSCNNQNCLSNSNKRNDLGQTEKVGHESENGQLQSNQNTPDQSGESEEESLSRELSVQDVENKLETNQTEQQLSEVEAQLGALSLATENPAQEKQIPARVPDTSSVEDDGFCVICEKKISLVHDHSVSTMHINSDAEHVFRGTRVVAPAGATETEFEKCISCQGVFYLSRMKSHVCGSSKGSTKR